MKGPLKDGRRVFLGGFDEDGFHGEKRDVVVVRTKNDLEYLQGGARGIMATTTMTTKTILGDNGGRRATKKKYVHRGFLNFLREETLNGSFHPSSGNPCRLCFLKPKVVVKAHRASLCDARIESCGPQIMSKHLHWPASKRLS